MFIKITRTLILFSLALLVPSVLFGQTKSITRENYYAALREAEAKTETQIRKRVQIQKLYSDGKITGTLTGISEYLPPDRSRWVYVEERGGVVTKFEQITIGNTIYRKDGDGEWTKRSKNDEGMLGLSGTDTNTREFFVEETIIDKAKVRVLIEKRVNHNQTFFDEVRTWITAQGTVLKKISTTSMLELSNIVSTVEVNYDYKAKAAKIEAPK